MSESNLNWDNLLDYSSKNRINTENCFNLKGDINSSSYYNSIQTNNTNKWTEMAVKYEAYSKLVSNCIVKMHDDTNTCYRQIMKGSDQDLVGAALNPRARRAKEANPEARQRCFISDPSLISDKKREAEFANIRDPIYSDNTRRFMQNDNRSLMNQFKCYGPYFIPQLGSEFKQVKCANEKRELKKYQKVSKFSKMNEWCKSIDSKMDPEFRQNYQAFIQDPENRPKTIEEHSLQKGQQMCGEYIKADYIFKRFENMSMYKRMLDPNDREMQRVFDEGYELDEMDLIPDTDAMDDMEHFGQQLDFQEPRESFGGGNYINDKSNSVQTVDIDNTPENFQLTQPMMNFSHEEIYESTVAKGLPDTDPAFVPVEGRLDLVNEFDVDLTSYRWIYKKENALGEKNAKQKRKYRRRVPKLNNAELEQKNMDMDYDSFLEEYFQRDNNNNKFVNINFEEYSIRLKAKGENLINDKSKNAKNKNAKSTKKDVAKFNEKELKEEQDKLLWARTNEIYEKDEEYLNSSDFRASISNNNQTYCLYPMIFENLMFALNKSDEVSGPKESKRVTNRTEDDYKSIKYSQNGFANIDIDFDDQVDDNPFRTDIRHSENTADYLESTRIDEKTNPRMRRDNPNEVGLGEIRMNMNVQKQFKRVDATKVRRIIVDYLTPLFNEDYKNIIDFKNVVGVVQRSMPTASVKSIFVALLQESNKNYWNVLNPEDKNKDGDKRTMNNGEYEPIVVSLNVEAQNRQRVN